MKNTIKVLGFAAIVAAIAFNALLLAGCPDGTETETTKIVATPTANPGAGTYTSAQNVALTSTAGATIYYTLDGTTPTTSSAQYSSAITISATTTLKAFAVKEDMDNSGILTAVYTITKSGTSSAEAIELTAGIWSDGNIPNTSGEQWFTFTTAESQTSVYLHYLQGTMQGASAQIYSADGTTAVGTSASLSGIINYASRTGLTAGTVYYIKVTPSFSTYKGTYKIGVNPTSAIPTIILPATGVTTLTEFDTWKDYTLPALSSEQLGEQWYKFTPTGTSVYVHFQLGTQRGLYVQLYDSDGKAVGSTTTIYGSTFSTSSQTVTAGKEYYIMVYYYSGGTYKMGINTSATPPIVTVPTTGVTALTADTWSTNGNIAAGGEQWFSFSATAATQYIHFNGGTLADILVRVYATDGTLITGTSANLDGAINRSLSRTLNVGTTYYIRVTPYANTYSGTYQIGFNARAETPVVETVGASPVSLAAVNTWYDGSITAIEGAQWFKFTSSTATGAATTVSQYIYFQLGTMTNVYVQLYTADGRMLGTRSSLASYSTYVSKTVTVSTEYYIKVTPYYSSPTTTGALGAFKLGFGTTSTVPSP